MIWQPLAPWLMTWSTMALSFVIFNMLGLVDHSKHSILWVTDCLMFEWNDSEQRLEALHHPFTALNPEDMDDLATARALAYDNSRLRFVCMKFVVNIRARKKKG